MIIAIMAAVLAAGGTYLVLQRGMLRTIIGMTLISHATNLIVLSTGVGRWRGEPLIGEGSTQDMADPLPQAFVLTAIVITMAVTAFMLALAALGRDDDTRIHEDREAMSQLSTAGRKARKHIPSDSDSTVAGTPGILGDRSPDAGGCATVESAGQNDGESPKNSFPKDTHQAGDSQW